MWKGRFDDMEKLWYKLNVRDRPNATAGLIPIDFKRQLLAAEEKTAPEVRLARAGLTLGDIHNAVMNDNAFADVNRKLKQAGDYFRKEYVMIPDSAGDARFDNRADAWKKFEAVLRIMQAHDEHLEVKDYLRQLTNSQVSLLNRAAEKNCLNKVFCARTMGRPSAEYAGLMVACPPWLEGAADGNEGF